jgi:hypothetical protein
MFDATPLYEALELVSALAQGHQAFQDYVDRANEFNMTNLRTRLDLLVCMASLESNKLLPE